jgi:AcrR family transcriptional regulator
VELEEEELGPLPSGRHGFSREQVAAHQRERLIAGLAAAVAKRGYNTVTIGHITKEARVSRRAFYAHFDSREACFLAAFDVVVAHLGELVRATTEAEPDWPHRVVAGLRCALEFFAAEPDLARLCMVESVNAGPAVAERSQEAIAGIASLLAAGRSERANPRPLPASTEESLVGALVSMAGRSVASGAPERLVDLLPDFVEFVLMPYLGPEEAHRLAIESSSAR